MTQQNTTQSYASSVRVLLEQRDKAQDEARRLRAWNEKARALLGDIGSRNTPWSERARCLLVKAADEGLWEITMQSEAPAMCDEIDRLQVSERRAEAAEARVKELEADLHHARKDSAGSQEHIARMRRKFWRQVMDAEARVKELEAELAETRDGYWPEYVEQSQRAEKAEAELFRMQEAAKEIIMQSEARVQELEAERDRYREQAEALAAGLQMVADEVDNHENGYVEAEKVLFDLVQAGFSDGQAARPLKWESILADRIRRERAEAWDEGAVCVAKAAAKATGSVSFFSATNPYRDGADDE